MIPPSGVIIVADQYNHRIRLITSPQPPALAACDSIWHHVALTYSPSASPHQLSAFLDGVLAFQLAATITLPARAASTLRVGWSGDLATNGGSLFAGSLSDLRVYSRSLSPAEVVALSQPLLPSVAHASQTPPAPTAGATAYSLACVAGYSGGTATLVRSAVDGSWAWAGGFSTPSCAACSPGTYSFGGAAACSSAARGETGR